ncbi:hypothetical protein YWIDRAFT_03913 [Streptomyces sp. SceaMP-e96]|uniref:hypothetical protein n=1 Tax=unclassified Streptomyces TaxID=2593676 RepID=UPI000823D0C1|nr:MULTISPECIES: hypothetical protein [unclassified Streptomyces]SCK60014.1 hypothetical protein YWIDRAFT_03913 [Streptomyces sp. SceaMP-e96]
MARAIAEADPDAVAATATLCGSGYKLDYAERLPDARRFGTLFAYTKFTTGSPGVCVLFDNNTGSAKHMKLKLCPNKTGATCKVDEDIYMWDANGRALINRVMSATVCD